MKIRPHDIALDGANSGSVLKIGDNGLPVWGDAPAGSGGSGGTVVGVGSVVEAAFTKPKKADFIQTDIPAEVLVDDTALGVHFHVDAESTSVKRFHLLTKDVSAKADTFELVVRVNDNNVMSDNNGIAVVLRDASSKQISLEQLSVNSTRRLEINQWTLPFTYVKTLATETASVDSFKWFRLSVTPTSLTAYVGNDGLSWRMFGNPITGSDRTYLGPITTVGFGIKSSANGPVVGKMSAHFLSVSTELPQAVQIGTGGSGSAPADDLTSKPFAPGVPAASSFTQVNFAGATITEKSNAALILTRGSTSVGHNLLSKVMPAAPFRVAIALSRSGIANEARGGACFMRDDGSYIWLNFDSQQEQVYVQTFSAAGVYGTTITQKSWFIRDATTWIGLRSDGTNLYYETSPDGVVFTTLYSMAKADFTKVGWGVGDDTGKTAVLRCWDEDGLDRTYEVLPTSGGATTNKVPVNAIVASITVENGVITHSYNIASKTAKSAAGPAVINYSFTTPLSVNTYAVVGSGIYNYSNNDQFAPLAPMISGNVNQGRGQFDSNGVDIYWKTTNGDSFEPYRYTLLFIDESKVGQTIDLPAGGASALADLTDVDMETAPPTDGQSLVWDATLEKWVPETVTGGGGGGAVTGMFDLSKGVPLMSTFTTVSGGANNMFTFKEKAGVALNVMYNGGAGGTPYLGGFLKNLANKQVGHWAVLMLSNIDNRNYHGPSIGFHDTATDRYLAFVLAHAAGYTGYSLQRWLGPANRQAITEPSRGVLPNAPTWLHVKGNGTTMKFGTSHDGANPVWYFEIAISEFMGNYDQLFFGAFAQGSEDMPGANYTILCYDDDADNRPMGGVPGGAGGGGSSFLAGLDDVAAPAPTMGQALVYNADSQKWVSGYPNVPVAATETGPAGENYGLVTHRYWRVYSTAEDGSEPYISLSNVEFRDVRDTPKQATGGTPISSGVYASNYGMENAFDGNNGTTYISNGSLPNWIGYDFVTPVGVAQLALRNRHDGYYTQAPAAFSVQWSDDGTNWTTEWSQSGVAWNNTLQTKTFNNPNVTPIAFQRYPVNLKALKDVSVSAPTDGQALVYEAATSKWKAKTPASSLASLTDVPSRTGQNGNMLRVKADGSGYEWSQYGALARGPNPHGSHRYWRFFPTAGNGRNDYITIADLAFRSTPGGVSVATGGTPIQSGNYDGNGVPANAFDGNASTYWESQKGTAGADIWIGYDFGTPVSVAEIGITAHASYSTNERPTQGFVQYSDNGTAWTYAWSVEAFTWSTLIKNSTSPYWSAVIPVAQAATETIVVALSDETTALTTGLAKTTIRMPYRFTLTNVRASLTTASTAGIPTVDINRNGTSIFSTLLTIDATEKSSKTAATPCALSTATLEDDDEITFDIDVSGTGATGLKVYLIGYQS